MNDQQIQVLLNQFNALKDMAANINTYRLQAITLLATSAIPLAVALLKPTDEVSNSRAKANGIIASCWLILAVTAGAMAVWTYQLEGLQRSYRDGMDDVGKTLFRVISTPTYDHVRISHAGWSQYTLTVGCLVVALSALIRSLWIIRNFRKSS